MERPRRNLISLKVQEPKFEDFLDTSHISITRMWRKTLTASNSLSVRQRYLRSSQEGMNKQVIPVSVNRRKSWLDRLTNEL